MSRLPLGSSTKLLENVESGMICSICDCLNSIAKRNLIDDIDLSREVIKLHQNNDPAISDIIENRKKNSDSIDEFQLIDGLYMWLNMMALSYYAFRTP